MTKNLKLKGMEQRLDAILEQTVVAKSGNKPTLDQVNQALGNTLSEMFAGCLLWGARRDEYFTCRMKEHATEIASYPQLVDLARRWEGRHHFHTLMHMLFSQGLLGHVDQGEMRDWTRKLDEIFESLTTEEYIPREGDAKRNTHMLLFYLNAYAKVAVADATQEEKQRMYALLGDHDKREILGIVAAIYYANPRLCSGYSYFSAVAGALIARRREHYASIFLTAERFARHERGCTFDWQSKRQHFYNLMVGWTEEKEQRAELVALLSVVFPKVEDWNPENNSFHPIRGKKRETPGISDEVRSYVDGKHQEAIGQIDSVGRQLDFVEQQLDKEVEMNRREHMSLSQEIGRQKGTKTTTINVSKDGIHHTSIEHFTNQAGASYLDFSDSSVDSKALSEVIAKQGIAPKTEHKNIQ